MIDMSKVIMYMFVCLQQLMCGGHDLLKLLKECDIWMGRAVFFVCYFSPVII